MKKMEKLDVSQCEEVTGGVIKKVILCIVEGPPCTGMPNLKPPTGDEPPFNLGDLGVP
jgi:hypothetical protein